MDKKIQKSIKFKNSKTISLDSFFEDNFAKFKIFANNFITDDYLCEDIVQDTFLILFNKCNKYFENETKLTGFIYITIKNKCINYLKSQKTHNKHNEIYSTQYYTDNFFLNNVIETEKNHIVYNAINQLPNQAKKIIKLHLKGFQNKEIANNLSISINTVKSIKTSAYKKLSNILRNDIY